MNAEPARRYSRRAAEELKGRTYGETASRYRTRGGAPERSRVYPSREGQNAISLPEVTEGRRIAFWERSSSEVRGFRRGRSHQVRP